MTDNIKRFEYTLRRRLDANASQVFLSGTDDVPEQYRKLVEQYYRSLSKGGGKRKREAAGRPLQRSPSKRPIRPPSPTANPTAGR